MSVGIVQHNFAETSLSGTTVQLTISSTSVGNLLVVCCGSNNTKTVTSVDDNLSQLYTQAPLAFALAGTHATDVWYILSTRAGVTSVQVTFSGVAAVYAKEVYVYEVSGFVAVAYDTSAGLTTGVGSANVDTGPTVTTTSPNGFIAAVVMTGGGVNINPNTGNEFTSGGDISTTNDASCSLISSVAGAHQPVWHDGSAAAAFCASAAAFKETFVASAIVSLVSEDFIWGGGDEL